MKINSFTGRYEIWKGRKKSLAKGSIEPGFNRVKRTIIRDLPAAPLELICWYPLLFFFWFFLYILIDRCLVQSAVSILYPNQWRSLKLYLPLPVCLICRCVFWLVIMFSQLLLCFLNCYFVFRIAFVICHFIFRIVICFALLGHQTEYLSFWRILSSETTKCRCVYEAVRYSFHSFSVNNFSDFNGSLWEYLNSRLSVKMFFALFLYHESVMISSLTCNVFIHINFQC